MYLKQYSIFLLPRGWDPKVQCQTKMKIHAVFSDTPLPLSEPSMMNVDNDDYFCMKIDIWLGIYIQ